jgi:isopenicillin N synthase-like dioxygenase
MRKVSVAVHTRIMAASRECSRPGHARSPLLTHCRFLHADRSPGSLQILPQAVHPSKATTPILAHTDQQKWISADPPPGCIVVNIGRMWSIWSGGLYPATLHRVIHTLPTERISAPFFFEPSFDAVVRVLDGARRKIKEEGMDVWEHEEVRYGDFLLDRIRSNIGIK